MKTCKICNEPAGNFYVAGIGNTCYRHFMNPKADEPAKKHKLVNSMPNATLDRWGI